MIDYALVHFAPPARPEMEFSCENKVLFQDELVRVSLENGVLSINAARDVQDFSELTEEEYLAVRRIASRLFEYFGKSVEFLAPGSVGYTVIIPESEEFDEASKLIRVLGFYAGKKAPLTVAHAAEISKIAFTLFNLKKEPLRQERAEKNVYKVMNSHGQAWLAAKVLKDTAREVSSTTLEAMKSRFSYLQPLDKAKILSPEGEWQKRPCVFCHDAVRDSHRLLNMGEMEVWANGYPYNSGLCHFMTVSAAHEEGTSTLSDEALLQERTIWEIAKAVMDGPVSVWCQRGPLGGQTVPHHHVHMVAASIGNIAELLAGNLVEVFGQSLPRLTVEQMQAPKPFWEERLVKKQAA
ncbi:MAG: hypothetical protein KDK48_01450 [Chlamydiia bacterium]|nr:hypothetical protein [Chlamydiia bacterium]